jgi:hypothetical protein
MAQRCMAVWIVSLSGCMAVQGGARMGHAFRNGVSTDDEIAWAGHFAVVATHPSSFQVGFEVEGRAEPESGSLFTTGLLAGITTLCETCCANIALHADAGVPVAWTTAGGLYTGGTVELPFRLRPSVPTAERNRNFRVLGTSPALVPFLRYRFYRLRDDGNHEQFHDLSAGAALRVTFGTDLL